MGTINLPTNGTIYLDTDTLIYSVEKITPYAGLLQPLWLSAQAGVLQIATSELTLLETLVKPIRDGDSQLEATFRTLLLNSREVHTLPISRAILEALLVYVPKRV